MLDGFALARHIAARQLSCVEVMTAYLDHIERLNPRVNAIVALQDRANLLLQAREHDVQLARGELMGPLHGFPFAVKDLVPVRGIRMTMGSPILKDFVPPADSVMVERLRKAGAIFIGKTNTPEFGLGSHTYNPVYGATCNAYDQSRSAGGSSGGAAAALALRMLPIADGSDHAGSLRNPAGWNNLFGFRTSFGRVPADGRDAGGDLGRPGILGRDQRDVVSRRPDYQRRAQVFVVLVHSQERRCLRRQGVSQPVRRHRRLAGSAEPLPQIDACTRLAEISKSLQHEPRELRAGGSPDQNVILTPNCARRG